MKKLLLSAAAVAAVLSAPVAMADDNGPNNHPKQERANRADNPPRVDKAGPAANGSDMQGPGMSGNGPANRDRDNNADNSNGGNNRDTVKIRDNDAKTVVKKKVVDRSVILKVRANIRAPHRYHIARAYVRPAGWYQHRWTYGERLPRAFFAPEYFLLDFAAYGLLSPYDGYEWVRYGDDALLIDVETGEVIRVEYDVFY